MKKYYQHSLKWFLNRIGKRIYRRMTSCNCQHCVEVFREGVEISDRQHANYIYNCHNEMGIEYFDKKPI